MADPVSEEQLTCETAVRAAPAVVMDQHGNYWRMYPAGTFLGVEEDTFSMCPTTDANYEAAPVAIYREGRDLSGRQMAEMLAHIDLATADPLLKRAAVNAFYAWTMGRDMITEAEIFIQMVAVQVKAGVSRV